MWGDVSYFIIYLEILVSDPYFIFSEALGLYRRLFHFKGFFSSNLCSLATGSYNGHQWEFNWCSETPRSRVHAQCAHCHGGSECSVVCRDTLAGNRVGVVLLGRPREQDQQE